MTQEKRQNQTDDPIILNNVDFDVLLINKGSLATIVLSYKFKNTVEKTAWSQFNGGMQLHTANNIIYVSDDIKVMDIEYLGANFFKMFATIGYINRVLYRLCVYTAQFVYPVVDKIPDFSDNKENNLNVQLTYEYDIFGKVYDCAKSYYNSMRI